MDAPTAAVPRLRRTRGRMLFNALWQSPLWALPFALFFSFLDGVHDLPGFIRYYLVSLVFSATVRLFLWIGDAWASPWADVAFARDGGAPLVIDFAIYGGLCITGSFVAAAIVHFTLLPTFLGSPRAVLLTFLFAALFTVLFGGIVYAMLFYRLAVDRARAIEQTRAQLVEAELRALRAQMNPHFLFNTLNTIAALVREDPDGAEDTTTRLAELFRYALRASERERAALGDELAFVRDYLAIEHRRFGARLAVREDVAPGLASCAVPTLLLQPLVENAVRHGIGARPEGGTVTIRAWRDAERLEIEIVDDGPGFADAPRTGGNGFGLHAVRERLRALGAPHALAIDSTRGVGTRMRVTLPLLPPDVTAAPPSVTPPGPTTCAPC